MVKTVEIGAFAHVLLLGKPEQLANLGGVLRSDR